MRGELANDAKRDRSPSPVRLAAGLLLALLVRAQDPVPSVRASASVPAATVARVEQMVVDGLARLTARFPDTPLRPFTVFVHRTRAEVPEPVREAMHEGSPGVALLGALAIHLVLDEANPSPPGDLATVVDHELVHILLHLYAGRAGPWIPRWFHEGLAQHLTGFLYVGASEEEIVFGLRADTLPRLRDLQRDFPRRSAYDLRIAYALSHSWVSYLERELGLPVLLRVARRCRADLEFPEAFLEETRTPLTDLEAQWREYVRTGSGAAMRVVLQQCFGLLVILALPLLALAAARRWNVDHARRRQLLAEEQAAERLRAQEEGSDEP
jgi:hypothetical protein